jgi:hypothetical protein
MLADDIYRPKLQQTIAALEEWAKQIAPVARVERSDSEANWRMRVVPTAANACPCELILWRDQRFDIAIGEESYEDLAVPDLAIFLPLLQAVAAGNVITRRWISSATGLEHKVETIVRLPDGTSWRAERTNPLAPQIDEIALECQDRHYVPYFRRSTG